MSQTVGGNLTAFARLVRTNGANVHGWIRREIRPELTAALHIYFACGIALSDLLQTDPSTLQSIVTMTTRRAQVQRRIRFPPTFKLFVQQELQNTLASEQYPPDSLAEVARRCGCLCDTLRRCNPAACEEISARYRAYLHQKKHNDSVTWAIHSGVLAINFVRREHPSLIVDLRDILVSVGSLAAKKYGTYLNKCVSNSRGRKTVSNNTLLILKA